LHRHDRKETGACALDLIDVHFGQADVADLPCALRLLQKPELLILGHAGVEPVQLIQVDALQAQASQAAFELFAQTFGPAVHRPFVRS
jgi:hypothetical protein